MLDHDGHAADQVADRLLLPLAGDEFALRAEPTFVRGVKSRQKRSQRRRPTSQSLDVASTLANSLRSRRRLAVEVDELLDVVGHRRRVARASSVGEDVAADVDGFGEIADGGSQRRDDGLLLFQADSTIRLRSRPRRVAASTAGVGFDVADASTSQTSQTGDGGVESARGFVVLDDEAAQSVFHFR